MSSHINTSLGSAVKLHDLLTQMEISIPSLNCLPEDVMIHHTAAEVQLKYKRRHELYCQCKQRQLRTQKDNELRV